MLTFIYTLSRYHKITLTINSVTHNLNIKLRLVSRNPKSKIDICLILQESVHRSKLFPSIAKTGLLAVINHLNKGIQSYGINVFTMIDKLKL